MQPASGPTWTTSRTRGLICDRGAAQRAATQAPVGLDGALLQVPVLAALISVLAGIARECLAQAPVAR